MKRISKILNCFGLGLILNLVMQTKTLASCGCARCPIETRAQEKLEKGLVRFDYSFQ